MFYLACFLTDNLFQDRKTKSIKLLMDAGVGMKKATFQMLQLQTIQSLSPIIDQNLDLIEVERPLDHQLHDET